MYNIQRDLLRMQNHTYKEFHKKLIPTVNESSVIGILIPLLRSYAKGMKQTADLFLKQLPHTYYEENMLHGLLLSLEKDIEVCFTNLNEFLPYVDNWAVCDSIRPQCFAKNKKLLLSQIQEWLDSSHEYTIRFAVEMLMVHFLDDAFRPEYLQWVAQIKSDKYYVNMMIAWYFATALSKRWYETIPYILEQKLSLFVHNKTIQKAVESYRISQEQKELLKGCRSGGKGNGCNHEQK